MVRIAVRGVRLAVGFLTRIPTGGDDLGGDGSTAMAGAVPWFPVVGLVIGVAHGLVFVGMSELVNPLLAATLSVAATLLITGAFHHDGLADMADAFGGGWTAEQRLEILEDPRLGTYGTSALVLALAIEVAAIASLEPWEAFAALVSAHALGRAAAVAVMVVARPAGDGMGASYMADVRTRPALTGAAIGLVAALLLLATTSAIGTVAAIAIAALTTAAIVVLANRKIGGVTGDVLGATTVGAILAVLIAVAAS